MTNSTYERMMKDPEFAKEFNKIHKKFLFQEFLLSIMNRKKWSVRKLSNEVGLSKNIIQDLKSGKQKDLKLSNFIKIANSSGFHVFLVNDTEKIEVDHYMNS